MKIEAIDIYWAKLPLAFVWKTSYADQYHTDTILVRMEGGGHYAWGESCPPYIPGYSADHTVATFHTLRDHMAPKIIGQGGVTLVGGAQFISLRARGIGNRPGNDDGSLTAEGYLIFDLVAGRRFRNLDVNLTVNNVLNSAWREAQFADESRITPTGQVVEQMHFTPGMPLTATVTVAYAL